MALFNRPNISAGESYLAELKCGRMTFNSETSLVSPDPEKGVLYVKKSVDNLIHLCWKNRKSSVAAEDWTVFEGDTSVRFIKELPEHRVFFIKFTATGKRMFYWLQHADQDEDEKLMKQLNMALNKTNERLAEIRAEKKVKEGSSRNAGIKLSGKGLKEGGIQIPNITNASELLELYQSGGISLGNNGQIDVNDFNQVLSQLGGKATTPKASSSKKSRAKNKSSTIVDTPKTILKNKPVRMEELQSAMTQAFAMTQKSKIDLTKILNKDSLSKLLADKTIQERLNKHMPVDEKFEKTESEILKTVGSPQYQQALTAFQQAFESGQLAGVLKQFNLPDEVVNSANGGNLEIFGKNLEKSLGKVKDDEQSSSNVTSSEVRQESEKMDAGENVESSVKKDEKDEKKDDMVTE